MSAAGPALRRSTVNLLGAVADAVSDGTAAAVAGSGHAGTGAVALSALLHLFDVRDQPPPTVDRLRQVLGLTHSGAVRLVDRLERDAWVVRTPGADARSRVVTLTAAGRRHARAVSDARTAHLSHLLDDLEADDVAALHVLLGRVAARVVAGKDGGAWICRRCDLAACGRAAGTCPVANAAVAKHGLPSSVLER